MRLSAFTSAGRVAAIAAACAAVGPAAVAQAYPYAERGKPSGPYAGHAAKGTVMLVHGGAWELTGARYVRDLRGEADVFRRLGWATVNVDYRPGASSYTDVRAAYDRLRSQLGRSARICLYGQSAGGHLAVLTATARPSVECVIAEAGPMNLASLAGQPAQDPATGGRQTIGPAWVASKAADAFGPGALKARSPVHRASGLRARLLLATASTDALVPPAQQDEMQRAAPGRVTVMRLPGASSTAAGSAFTHAPITRFARRAWELAKRQFLNAPSR